MKYFVQLMLVFLFVSCNTNSEFVNTDIETFEKLLGEEQTLILNEIIDDFDDFLSTEYPNMETDSIFKYFLTDVIASKKDYFWEIDSSKVIRFINSKLFHHFDTIYPDSVWFDGHSFNIKYNNVTLKEKGASSKTDMGDAYIDSILNSIKNNPRFEFSEKSDFYKSLDSIKYNYSIIGYYLTTTEMFGSKPSVVLARGLLNHLHENNVYFAKRIYIINMYER